jgi:hypothetical protein
MPRLRSLRVEGLVANLNALKEKRRLQQLYLDFIDEGETLGPLATLISLRRLEYGGRIRDLSPLGSLPQLTHIAANFSLATTLPKESMPALTRLEVLSTSLTADEVQRFQRTNPQTKVYWRYEDLLRDDFAGADEITVDWNSRCDPKKARRTVVKGAEVDKLLKAIAIKSPKRSYVMGCDGDVFFHLARNGKKIGVFAYFEEGGHLHYGGWPGHAPLTKSSRAAVIAWLGKHEPKSTEPE